MSRSGGAAVVTTTGDQQIAGTKTLTGPLDHDGAQVGFFGTPPAAKPAALTAANATAFTAANASAIDLVWGAEESAVLTNLRTRAAEHATVLDNVRTRLNQLEARMQSLGLLT